MYDHYKYSIVVLLLFHNSLIVANEIFAASLVEIGLKLKLIREMYIFDTLVFIFEIKKLK